MIYLLLGLGATALGYVLYLAIQKFLPQKLKSDQSTQREEMLADARQQADRRRKSEAERLIDEAALQAEQFEADMASRTENLAIAEVDLDARDRNNETEEARVAKIEKDLETHTAKVEVLCTAHAERLKEVSELKSQLVSTLESKAGINAAGMTKQLQDKLIESRRMEAAKSLRFHEEELSSSGKRTAQRVMARALARYAPDFYWPKSVNMVELPDRKALDRLMAEGVQMMEDFKQKAQIEMEILPGEGEHQIPLVKLAGGAGVDREAVRLAMTELVPKGATAWAKAGAYYDKHRAIIEQQAILLGREAVREVQLEGIHPEVQKLVGYLNWRTSYRQNQWYHTVEVSKLAGIIANEIGVDPDAAKRVGLLHDIGKALDYRIDGSHAVISGDYADRFGESRLICDTVMSHHNDLVIETPLAYVLRAADTLSGARPGARVNLEEGYQTRLSGIESAVRSFPGIVSISIMNGAREVHVEVNSKRVKDSDLEELSKGIARKIEAEVAFPGEIKILVSRRNEASAVA